MTIRSKPEDVVSILSFMDEARQREVYLRIARAAAIAGKSELASMSAARAQALAGNADNAFGALADFYGGMAAIPTDKINAAAKNIDTIADSDLSPRDKALRAAAKSVAEQVLRAPDPASLTQGSSPKSNDQEMTSEQADIPQVAEHGGEHDAAPSCCRRCGIPADIRCEWTEGRGSFVQLVCDVKSIAIG
jgi:chemotaxis protein MotC